MNGSARICSKRVKSAKDVPFGFLVKNGHPIALAVSACTIATATQRCIILSSFYAQTILYFLLYDHSTLYFYRSVLNAGRLSQEKVVCPSVCHVCPSACQTRALLQNGRRSVQIFTPYERLLSLVFREEVWLVKSDPFYLKFWVIRPPLERNRRL